jgi:hypothetical protein
MKFTSSSNLIPYFEWYCTLKALPTTQCDSGKESNHIPDKERLLLLLSCKFFLLTFSKWKLSVKQSCRQYIRNSNWSLPIQILYLYTKGLQFTAREPHFTVPASRISNECHFRAFNEIKTLLHVAKTYRSHGNVNHNVLNNFDLLIFSTVLRSFDVFMLRWMNYLHYIIVCIFSN